MNNHLKAILLALSSIIIMSTGIIGIYAILVYENRILFKIVLPIVILIGLYVFMKSLIEYSKSNTY